MAKKAKKRAKAPKIEEQAAEQSINAEETVEEKFDKFTTYSVKNGFGWVKKLSREKFDASVELHVRLGIDPRKGDQQIRTAVSLPHGTGKTVKVAAFVTPEKEKEVKEAGADIVGGEDLVNEIKKTEKTDFQVAVAEPSMMRFVGQIGKILGTRGLMPSPKNDTVTPDPAKAVGELKRGKVSFKNDDTGNIHVAIGKISFEVEKLIENYETIIDTLKKLKPPKSKGVYIRNICVSSSMGPGVKLQASK